jgi:hypothetical protein
LTILLSVILIEADSIDTTNVLVHFVRKERKSSWYREDTSNMDLEMISCIS